MTEVDLGFPEELENAAQWLCNRYFPSKVGGRPAWLELEVLPTKEQLQCKKCKDPMTFLCQIYAPGDEDHNFHRTIYVFICREPQCQTPNEALNLEVFRSQLPLKNDFYSDTPPDEFKPEAEIEAKKKLCLVCGCPGPLTCGRCKKANYCSQKHQRIMWPIHKETCGQVTEKCERMSGSTLGRVVFPECEIVIEANAANDLNDKKNHVRNDLSEDETRLKEYQDLASQGKTGTFADIPDQELEKYARGVEAVDDKHFRHFKKSISNAPGQIIRYKRKGNPLWIADTQQTIAAQLNNIPKCELCGTAREFEFQIMPQLLLLLKDDSLDWGVLAIYTCPKNCELPKEIGYAREHIIKQDLVSDKK